MDGSDARATVLRYRYEEFPGEHVALVSRNPVERVQRRRRSRVRVRPPARKSRWALRGLVFCARCERPIHCETHANGTPYYRERHNGACDTVGRAVSAARIDAEVGDGLAALRIDDRWRERLVTGPCSRRARRGAPGAATPAVTRLLMPFWAARQSR